MPLAVSRVMLCVAFSLSLLCGCGESTDDAGPSVARVCARDTSFSCTRGGCSGHQSCLEDGSAFTPCVCDAESNDAGDDSDAMSASGAERCDNGKDDDGNGKVDCADSACSAVSCTEQAPKGWLGPIALRVGDDDTTCSGSLSDKAFEAGDEPHAEAASCSTCTCSGGDSACSAFVNFEASAADGCNGSSCTTSVNQACVQVTPPCLKDQSNASLKTKLPAAAGACKPSTPSASLPEAKWNTRVLACAAPSADHGGCKSDQLCLPRDPGADFAANYCVWKDGDTACPSATFGARHVYYRALHDTRACTACACSGPNCSYQWQVFDPSDAMCKTPVLTLSSVDQCVQANVSAGALRVGAEVTGDGKCTPSGGDSAGDVTASAPLTVCCKS
jgi:hypothetical protein